MCSAGIRVVVDIFGITTNAIVCLNVNTHYMNVVVGIKASSRATKQTNKQSGKQTSSQANKQTISRPTKQTTK
jgi:hypothetical protein